MSIFTSIKNIFSRKKVDDIEETLVEEKLDENEGVTNETSNLVDTTSETKQDIKEEPQVESEKEEELNSEEVASQEEIIEEEIIESDEKENKEDAVPEETKVVIPFKYTIPQIRPKFRNDTLQFSDIENIKKYLPYGDKRTYYLILIAACEKLGQKYAGLQIIKQMEQEGIEVKGIDPIKQRLKSKKSPRFDLDKWDKIIGWDLSAPAISENEEVENDDYPKEVAPTVDTIDVKEIIEEKIAKEDIKNGNKSKEDVKKDNSIKAPKYVTNKSFVVKTNASTKKKNRQYKKEVKPSDDAMTIYETLPLTIKDAIEKINCNYYANMQPHEAQKSLPKEYYQALEGIKQASKEDKKKRTEVIQRCLNEVYEETRQVNSYVKKYDKLQSILYCKPSNKRAQMELMLVLMNEGYGLEVATSFPEEDVQLLQNIIEQVRTNKINATQAKKNIDDYCR